MSDAVVVEHVTKRFVIDRERESSLKGALTTFGRRHSTEDFLALDDVSFQVPTGSTFGIVGANGSGKSTLLKCIARILRPDGGRIEVEGRIASLLELGSGFREDLSGRENVFLNGSILGLSKKEVAARYDEIVHWAELERFIDSPIKTYSSGMRARLGFAVATTIEADVLLLDEVLAVGDMNFRQRSRHRMNRLLASGCTILLVAHDLSMLRSMCDSGISLKEGQVEVAGPIDEVLEQYEERMRAANELDPESPAAPVISSVQLLNADGAPVDELSSSDRSILRVRVDTSKYGDQAILALGLHSGVGTMVAFDAVPDALNDLPPSGFAEIDVVIDALPLVDGAYDWTVAVRDAATNSLIDRRERIASFVLQSDPPAAPRGVIPLRLDWQRRLVDPEPSTEPAAPSETMTRTLGT